MIFRHASALLIAYGTIAVSVGRAAPTDTFLSFSEQQGDIAQFVEIGHAAEFDLNGGAFTVSAWIKPTTWGDSNQGRIIDHGGGSGPTKGWTFQIENSSNQGQPAALRFRINNDNSFDGLSDPDSITLGAWQHVAITLDSGNLTFFVNGQSAGIRTAVPTPGAYAIPVRVGGRATDFRRAFDGSIDEVRIWSRALSQQEIQNGMNMELAGTEPGLIAYYRFNEASGQLASDSALNGYHGQLGITAGPDVQDPIWQLSVPVNQSPSVDAGADRIIVLPTDSTALDGTVMDDGLPGTPLVVAWTMDSGPGLATFADPWSVDTTVTFTDVGAYTLRLSADDGELQSSDTMNVMLDSVAILTAITVMPSTAMVAPGSTEAFNAEGFDQAGDSFPIIPTWSATGGSVNQSGAYLAGLDPGSASVMAADNSISGSATVIITDPSVPWPTLGWESATPAELAMDELLLEQARHCALQGSGSGMITRFGKLAMSWGSLSQLYQLKSSTKSIGVTALGLALQDNLVLLTDSAQAHLAEFGVPPISNEATGWLPGISLVQLATHSPGFKKPGGYIDLEFQPGTTWSYSDGGANWLADVLTAIYATDLRDLMFSRVFGLLGIQASDLSWRTHSYRDKFLNGIIRREFGSGIGANVDAMARIGYLYLRRGSWNGQNIIPASFVAEASHPHPSLVGVPVGGNQEQHPGASDHYGLLWWNNGDGTLVDVPTDAYWSWGLRDSLIVVIPSLDVVAVRAGDGWRQGWDSDYTVIQPFLESIVFSATGGAPANDDNDSVPNNLDNCTLVPNGPCDTATAGFSQNDTDGDGFGNMCDADLDNSGFVNVADLAAFKAAFGTSDPDADFDGSGFVNFGDLARFKALFGQPPGPSEVAP